MSIYRVEQLIVPALFVFSVPSINDTTPRIYVAPVITGIKRVFTHLPDASNSSELPLYELVSYSQVHRLPLSAYYFHPDSPLLKNKCGDYFDIYIMSKDVDIDNIDEAVNGLSVFQSHHQHTFVYTLEDFLRENPKNLPDDFLNYLEFIFLMEFKYNGRHPAEDHPGVKFVTAIVDLNKLLEGNHR